MRHWYGVCVCDGVCVCTCKQHDDDDDDNSRTKQTLKETKYEKNTDSKGITDDDCRNTENIIVL